MTVELAEFKGIYIASEAAIYLNATLKRDVPALQKIQTVHSRNLIHWIRVGLISPELTVVPGKELLVGFEDLIAMRVVAILRALGVSWKKIHKAETWLREQTGYVRPFAIERVWTETTDIFADFHILGEYLSSVQDITFVPHNDVKVADSWTPHEDVLISPRVQFGEPCIKGTRIRTRIINDLLVGGDTIPYVMHSFELTEQQITHVLEWENRLKLAKEKRSPVDSKKF